MYTTPFRSVTTIALIDGKEVEYNACCDVKRTSLDEAKAFYSAFKYIGKGIIYKVDGVKQSFTEQCYFFK